MKIAIKSETDSRTLIYPLLKVLNQYGTVALFSSNPYVARLIEDELEGGFRNIVIVPVLNDDLRSAEEEEELFEGKYDYVIYDNVGCIDYDYLIFIVTNHITEEYMDDIKLVIDEDGVFVVKFGKPAPKKSGSKPKKPANKKAKSKKGEEVAETTKESESSQPKNINDILKEESESEVSDDEYNKWTVEKTDSEILLEKINLGNSKWCKFITMEQVEELESHHKFYKPDDSILKEIYRIIGSKLGVDERMFMKAGKLADDSNTIVQGIDIS